MFPSSEPGVAFLGQFCSNFFNFFGYLNEIHRFGKSEFCGVMIYFVAVCWVVKFVLYMKCSHGSKRYRVVLSCGAVQYAVQGDSNF